jgi:Fe-Mn family superoxide dismutase
MLAATGLVAAAAVPRIVFAQGAMAPTGPFKLDPLAYPTNALEPHIDAKTMEIHHDRHHQAFITNLNNFAKDNPQIADKPVPEVLAGLSSVPEAIRIVLTGRADGPELDLLVPAIDRGAELPSDAGIPAILGCRERAAAFARALETSG